MKLTDRSTRDNENEKWGCGLVVFDRRGLVLMGLRCKPTDLPQWSFAGGHVEIGESPRDAVIRELREEMSLEAKDPIYIDYFIEGEEKDFVFVVLIDDCIGSPSANKQEFSELKWMMNAELIGADALEVFPYSLKALAILKKWVFPSH